jgi:hypothetical protein
MERIMKTPTLWLRLISLLSLILLASAAAFSQITPLGDTYTNSAAATTNYGSQKTLNVDAAKEITYVQFNLASIPTGASISQATLKLYVNTVVTAGAFELYAVNGPWTESGLSYSIAPALGAVIDSNVPITTADKNQYILIPMTATVQEWLTTPSSNNGIALVAVGSFNATFDSKETATTSHPPELDIVFAGTGSGITGINTAAGSGLIGGGTSGTLNLSLTNTCAASQILQWNGSAWACASPGTGTITGVTAGTDLTGGGSSGNVTLSLNTAATNALYAQLGAANTFVTNQTVDGTFTASSSGDSILGISTSAAGIGVWGSNIAQTGAGAIAVLGQSTSTAGGIAVVGQTAGEDYYYFTNGAVGVEGGTNSPAGAGMWGLNTASTGLAMGVYGTSSSAAGTGVYGSDSATTGTTFGVTGTTVSNSGFGVFGQASSSTGSTNGVYGVSDSDAGFGVVGASNNVGVAGEGSPTFFSTAGLPYGVLGLSATTAVYGASDGVSTTGGGIIHLDGVWGDYGGEGGGTGAGVLGTADNNWAGMFYNNSPTVPALTVGNDTTTAGGEVFFGWLPNLVSGNAAAIIGDPGCSEGAGNMALQLGQTGMSGCTNYTLLGNDVGGTYLNGVTGQAVHLRIANADVVKVSTGAVSITGTLSATGTKNFRIDHPLDPGNKYLTHAAIESSEVLNLYSGNATLDGSGSAVVQLPDWFEAINKDFRYQLTPIGAPGRDLYVAEEISGGHFKIAGGTPAGKVSWQVTGVRNDAWEKAYPMVVEADKGSERGHYLTPELYGQPASARIGYEAVPEGQPIVHHQRPNLARSNGSPAKTIRLVAPPKPVLPKAARLPHAVRQANKPEVNQK